MSNNLKKFLQDRGIKQTELAKESDRSISTISKICLNTMDPGIVTKNKIIICLKEKFHLVLSEKDVTYIFPVKKEEIRLNA